MTDFSKLMEKAKEIENKMKESQENIKKIEVEGVSGANDVKVTLNGEGAMISIKLSENVLKEEKVLFPNNNTWCLVFSFEGIEVCKAH